MALDTNRSLNNILRAFGLRSAQREDRAFPLTQRIAPVVDVDRYAALPGFAVRGVSSVGAGRRGYVDLVIPGDVQANILQLYAGLTLQYAVEFLGGVFVDSTDTPDAGPFPIPQASNGGQARTTVRAGTTLRVPDPNAVPVLHRASLGGTAQRWPSCQGITLRVTTYAVAQAADVVMHWEEVDT